METRKEEIPPEHIECWVCGDVVPLLEAGVDDPEICANCEARLDPDNY